jgi:dolichol-phosphate mannosyltransferase
MNNGLLIFTATLNECKNIPTWYTAVRGLYPEATLLVVDDNSIDGTKEYLLLRQAEDKYLKVIVRGKKLGLGSAHKLAFAFSLDNGFKHLVTMDADLSHRPDQISRILSGLIGSNFVIGSRTGLGTNAYTGFRKLLSTSANKMCKVILPTPVNEYTTSFRGFDKVALSRMSTSPAQDDGYSFFIEVVDSLHVGGISMSEVPIDFDNRAQGKSKIPKNQVLLTLTTLIKLWIKRMKR